MAKRVGPPSEEKITDATPERRFITGSDGVVGESSELRSQLTVSLPLGETVSPICCAFLQTDLTTYFSAVFPERELTPLCTRGSTGDTFDFPFSKYLA